MSFVSHSASEILVCVNVTDAPPIFVQLLQAQTAAFHFIIMSPLFIHPTSLSLSFSLLSHLSYLRPLFYFSNSIPLIHFYGSLCSCLLSRPFLSLPLISFFLFDLNFLISSLICITRLGFMLTLPALPMMTVIVPPFAFLFPTGAWVCRFAFGQ